MVLSRLTKITGPGVATDTNWVGNNADFTGITTTATSFNIGVTTIHSNLIEAHNIKSTGIITATGGSFSGNVTAVDGTFSGNVSIAGTLTYEDVTNIDSVGIITAPALDVDDFLDVGSSIKLGNAGVITATSFVGSGAALTGIDATAIKDSGGNVKIQAQASGAMYTGIHTFSSGAEVGSNIKLGNAGVVTATSFTGSGANLTSLPAGQLTGTVADARISTLTASKLSGALPAISGANLTNLDASDLASGTVPTARLGSGTASSSTFLRGDSTFAAVTSTTINSNTNNYIITGTGTANELQGESELQWNGSNLFVRAGEATPASLNLIADQGDDNGDGWKIQSEQDENDLTFKSNISGSYVDKLKLKSNGQLEVQGNLISTGKASFPDGNSNGVTIGNKSGGDLRIFHNGSNSYLENDTGNLVIDNGSGVDMYINSGNDIYIRPQGSDNGIKLIGDGAVELYFNGSKKLETLSYGVQIHGALTAGNNINFGDNTSRFMSGSANQLQMYYDGSNAYINNTVASQLKFATNNTVRCQLQSDGHWAPVANNTYDLGTSSMRWRNIYTNDLNLSNEGSTNSIDNTWGDWTIQEGESDVYMINNRSGKKFKIKMEEVL